MSSEKYIKGVRTRHRNSLEREIKCCNEILARQTEECNKEQDIVNSTKCIKLLKSYCEKVEIQSEKYISLLQDSDDDVEQILDEDYSLCAKAMECCVELEEYRAYLQCTGAKSAKTEQNQPDVNVSQLQMQSFMQEQSYRQQEFFERQIQRKQEFMQNQTENQYVLIKKIKEAEERPATVNLPKYELRSFNGNRLRWTEFWDQFECTIHNNKNLSDVEV